VLAEAVRPRAEYSVVHGELGLDHVLVDRDGNPVLIDIEDLMYFDVEWEHLFPQLRHPEGRYRRLTAQGLDGARLALHTLTQRLSLTAGPLRLLDGDFPDRAFMREIAEHHLSEALALVAVAGWFFYGGSPPGRAASRRGGGSAEVTRVAGREPDRDLLGVAVPGTIGATRRRTRHPGRHSGPPPVPPPRAAPGTSPA
jgi:hypothetical protein